MCSNACYTCTNFTFCEICKPEFYLYQGLCLTKCPKDTYRKADKRVCSNCAKPCKTCTDGLYSSCLTCQEGLFLHPSGECMSRCPVGFKPDASLGICANCSVVQCEDCNSFQIYSFTQQKCIDEVRIAYKIESLLSNQAILIASFTD